MSVENLKEYARRCATEPELRERAKAIGVRTMGDLEKHMEHASALGLEWNEHDMAAFRKEVVDADGDYEDLTEEELEQVAGGLVTAVATVAMIVGFTVGAGVAVGAGAGAAAGAGATAAASGGGW